VAHLKTDQNIINYVIPKIKTISNQ